MEPINKYQNGASYQNRVRRLRAKLQEKYIDVYIAWMLGSRVQTYHPYLSYKWSYIPQYTPDADPSFSDLEILFDTENRAGMSSTDIFKSLRRVYQYVAPTNNLHFRIAPNDIKQQDDNTELTTHELRDKLREMYRTEYTAWRFGTTIEYADTDRGGWAPVAPYEGSGTGNLLGLLFADGAEKECPGSYLRSLHRIGRGVDPVTKRRYRIKGEG